MFGSLGLPEILFILVLALLVFGPRRLPEVGRTIGKALGEFRRATGDLKRTFDQETSTFERESGLGPTAASPPESVPPPARTESTPVEVGTEAEAEVDEDAEVEAEVEADGVPGIEPGIEAEVEAEVERLPKTENGTKGHEPS